MKKSKIYNKKKMLSQQELLAERMYNLFRIGKMGHKSFIYNFRLLAEEEENISVYYLFWLLLQNADDNKYLIKLLRKLIKLI